MAWFDATQFDPATGGANFPIGRHPVTIRKVEVRPNKENTGGMLVLVCEIMDGQHKGAMGDYRLNIWNQNAQAQEIAQRQLSAVCHVTGRFKLEAEPKGCELIGASMYVIVEQQTGENAKYTQVVAVQDIHGNGPVKGQAGAGAAAQPAQQGSPPWGGGTPAAQPATQPASNGAAPWAANGQPAATQPAATQPAAATPPWQQQPAGNNAAPWAK